MRPARTIALGFLWLAAAAPIFLSALFLGGRLAIREMHWDSDGGGRLRTLTIPVSGLVWYEKDRELLLDGRMFDVVSLEVRDGVAHVRGFFDDLETELNRALEDTGGNGQPGTETGWRLFQCCLGILGIPTDAMYLEKAPRPEDSTSLYPEPSFETSQGHRRIPIPPPQPLALPDTAYNTSAVLG